MSNSSLLLSLAWCVLGYWFLDCGEIAYSMFSSMAALTTVAYRMNMPAYQRGSSAS